MRNALRPVLLFAVLVLALTGCVKVDADLKVGKDETVSGKMLMAVDKNAAEKLGTTPDKIKEQIETSIKKGAPKGVDCKSYEEGNYVGTECQLDKVPFKDMSGDDDGDLKFEKQGDKFVVSGGTGDATDNLPNQSELPKPDVKFKITMPGKILEHDAGAKVDGNTATYTDPAKMSTIKLTSDSSGGGFPAWALILIIVLVLLAIAAVVFFLLRGRKASSGQQFPGQQQYAGQYAGQQGQGGYPGQEQQWGQQGQQGQQWGGQQGQDQWGQQGGPSQGQGQYGGQQGGQGEGQGQYGGQQGGSGQGQGNPGQWGGQQNPQQGQQQNPQWGQQGQQGGGQYGGQQGNPGQGGQGQWGGQQGQQNPPQWGQPGQGPDDPGRRQ